MSNEVVSLKRTLHPEVRGFREYAIRYAGGLDGGKVLLPPGVLPELIEDILRDASYAAKDGDGRDTGE